MLIFNILEPGVKSTKNIHIEGVHIEYFGSMLSLGRTSYIRPYSMLVLHSIPIIIPNKFHYCWPPLSLSLHPRLPARNRCYYCIIVGTMVANQQHWDTVVRIAEDHCFDVPLGYPAI